MLASHCGVEFILETHSFKVRQTDRVSVKPIFSPIFFREKIGLTHNLGPEGLFDAL
jgi:hypothetical protein